MEKLRTKTPQYISNGNFSVYAYTTSKILNRLLEGTPKETGTYTFTITPNTTDGRYYNNEYTVQIDPSPSLEMNIIGLFRDGKRGAYYSVYIKTIGGSAPYTPSIISNRLPYGLYLVQEGERTYIRGIPTRAESQIFKLRITDANGYSVDSNEFTIKIAANSSYRSGAPDDDSAVKPSISSKTIPEGTIGSEWTTTLEAYGTQPIKWIPDAGFPEWLNLDEDSGAISGIPTEAGKYRFKVKAENEAGSATKKFKLKVVAEKPVIETRTLSSGVVNAQYEVQLEASGSEPLKWEKIGKLPSGLKLNKKDAKIEGTPKKTGTYNFSLKVKNKSGYDTVPYTLVIKEIEYEKAAKESTDEIDESTNTSESAIDVGASPSDCDESEADENGDFYTELFMVSGDEKIDGVITPETGKPLDFVVDGWVDENGAKVKVSDVKIFVNDEILENVVISDDGTFTLPEEIISGEFTVYASAQNGGNELKTEEIFVSAAESENETQNSGSSGAGCSISAGLAGLFVALSAFLKKHKKA